MPQTHREPLGVFGAGWVGLATAACFAELGHDVVVRDVAPERVAALKGGEVPIHEPGLASMLARNRDRIHFTADPRDVLVATEIVFVCVGTPSTYSGDADLSAVWRIVGELADVEEPLLLVRKLNARSGDFNSGAGSDVLLVLSLFENRLGEYDVRLNRLHLSLRS